jgi:cysteine dioxygenase
VSTIPKIKTLDQLKKIIHTGPGYDGIGQMLIEIDFDADELAAHCRWNHHEYQRISLDKGDSYELVLICWEFGQKSPIHDHLGDQGWVIVLQGQLEEEVYYNPEDASSLELKSREIIEKGQLSYINDQYGVHRLKNRSTDRTISLHYYTNLVEEVNVYDKLSGQKSRCKLH